jgi:putative inorganic carbon (HCO3(-)) transporter
MKSRLFYCYLALLCWIPLPLASKSLLAQNIFVLLSCLLVMACCFTLVRQREATIAPALRKALPACVLFTLSLIWVFLQFQPLPVEWITSLSPARTLYTGLDTPPSHHLTLSFYPWSSAHSLLLGIGYFQLFVLTLLLVDTESRLRALLYTIVILGTLQALYGSLMTLSGIEKHWWFDKEAHIGFATGTLLNRNHLANYLTYAAAAAIGLLLSSSRLGSFQNWRQIFRQLTEWLLGSKGWLRLSLIIMVIALILTRSRMGNMAFFISLSTTALIWLWLSGKFNRTTFILFASLFIIDAFLVGIWFGIDEVAARLENTSAEEEIRHQVLPYLLNMTQEFWLAGTGAGTFADTFPLYKQQMTLRWYNEAHIDYLQFFIEFGAIGSAPLLLIVLWSLAKNYQTIRYRHSPLLVATGFSCLMALTASGIHALVEYNLQRPATASLFVVFLALPWATAHMVSDKRKATGIRR